MKAIKIMDIDLDLLGAIKYEVFKNYELFNQWTLRQDYPGSCHSDTKSIILRISKGIKPDSTLDTINEHDYMHELECDDWSDNLVLFPKLNELINILWETLDADEVGWVTIVSLPPGKEIAPHPDEGKYCEYYNRFHIPLFTKNSPMSVGNETFNMKEGELWAFNNQLVHSTKNDTDQERIHLIFDAI